ncbi:hypothetical protein BO85DRAFT_454014 [Aspergillus piperis CBS 112811]|uniref:Uncharacterized protein n=1 Tax=Aspergillus piperis CBS 112811 TaxID=1448313 RepID=A0A8G1QS01_9EURO|nr:hypothetical protein BO85DRAFT_454014 [Aspergillus piperis CBS 112811]RAH52502.1 hypothetical protein BO85DRAFT_454014 [Aspergillus piperis CBS 112811]
MASTFIGCADGILHCVLCQLDSTVLRLLMTALQKIFSWVYMGYSKQPEAPQLPPVHFGDWRVSEQDGEMVKLLLTKHVLSLCRSVVRNLQLRVDEMHLLAKVQTRFHCMDTASMSVLAERLASSLSDVTQLVRHYGKEKYVIPDSPSSQQSPERSATVAESG